VNLDSPGPLREGSGEAEASVAILAAISALISRFLRRLLAGGIKKVNSDRDLSPFLRVFT